MDIIIICIYFVTIVLKKKILLLKILDFKETPAIWICFHIHTHVAALMFLHEYACIRSLLYIYHLDICILYIIIYKIHMLYSLHDCSF